MDVDSVPQLRERLTHEVESHKGEYHAAIGACWRWRYDVSRATLAA